MLNSREQFEEWYLAEYYEGDKQCGLEWLSIEPCGGYRYAEPAKEWKVWKASRASITVELPPPMAGPTVDEDDDDYEQFELHETVMMEVNGMRSKCRKGIEAAGVKVKP